MEILIKSFLLILVTEMGDKTQLLALLLVARYRRPWVIMSGILIATLLNHGFAAYLGEWLALQISPGRLKWMLAIVFFAFAAWVLIPDKEETPKTQNAWGALVTTIVTFFLAEMGDKTQLSTVALAARYQNLFLVTFGTTLGMLVADGLAVFYGEKVISRFPMKYLRRAAAVLFLFFGLSLVLGF